MNYSQAIRFLYGLEHGAVKLGLERIQAAIEERGHPERRYATVHVAGTNGKGSTCALLTAILAAAGYRTGLLTSPHLLEYTERIRIAGELVRPAEIARWTVTLAPLIRRLHLSFFEATTLLAFELFAHHRVEIAVIEVGMGGRLDATNVIVPDLTVVTGIDLDHTQSLGATRERIAGEKAGILKAGAPLLLGHCRQSVRRVFERRAAALAVPVHALDSRIVASEIEPRPEGTRYRWHRLPEAGSGGSGRQIIRLRGEHQVHNALLAAEAARLLRQRGWCISEAALKRGLATAHWPGRFDVVSQASGEVRAVVDVAHNPQGAGTLARTWRRWLHGQPHPELIVGMLGDKAHEEFLRRLCPLTQRVFLVPLASPRAGSLRALARAARRAGLTPHLCSGIADAWQRACLSGRPVVVTGSFLTVEAGLRLLRIGARRRLFELPRPVGRPAPSRGRARAGAEQVCSAEVH